MVTYQRLTDKELDTFIQMRIRQLREEGATEDIDLVPHLKDYYNRHMADGTFVSWLAMDGDKIIATSGMSLVVGSVSPSLQAVRAARAARAAMKWQHTERRERILFTMISGAKGFTMKWYSALFQDAQIMNSLYTRSSPFIRST